jgi:hypothetical protein
MGFNCNCTELKKESGLKGFFYPEMPPIMSLIKYKINKTLQFDALANKYKGRII